MRIAVLALAVLLSSCSSTGRHGGPLEIDLSMPCMPLDAWLNELDPPTALGSMVSCAAKGEYQRAAEMSVLSTTYMHFDQERVPDRTAHAATGKLVELAADAMSKSSRRALQAAVAQIERAPAERRRICELITELGAPGYEPVYMANYGINAAAGKPVVPLSEDGRKALWGTFLPKHPICRR